MRLSKGRLTVREEIIYAEHQWNHVEEWFTPCNPKLAVSEVTEPSPLSLKLSRHVLLGRAYLSVFVGSGLTTLASSESGVVLFDVTGPLGSRG